MTTAYVLSVISGHIKHKARIVAPMCDTCVEVASQDDTNIQCRCVASLISVGCRCFALRTFNVMRCRGMSGPVRVYLDARAGDVSIAGSPFARNCLESRLQSGGTSKYRRHDRPRPTTDIDTGTVAVDIDMTSRPIRTKTRQNESPLERNVRKRRFYMHVIQQRTTRIF